MLAKVTFDNGYKIELIRPMRDIPMALGTAVDYTISKEGIDLIKLFNEFITDETKQKLIDELQHGAEVS